jgi:drug/metabolite transporter (DMT)-like permease
MQIPTYGVMLVFGIASLQGSIFAGVTPLIMLLMLLLGLAQVYFNKVSLIAQKHVETAPYMVLRQVYVPVSVLLSTIFLGETLDTKQIVGMFVIMSGTYLIASNGGKVKIKHFRRYELMTIAYGVYLAFYSIIIRYLQIKTSLSTILVLGGLLELIPSFVTTHKVSSKISLEKLNRKEVLLACFIGLFSAMHIVTFWLAVNYAQNVAIVSSVSSFRIVTVFVGSYLLLNEKANFKLKLAGTIIALIGLLLV